MYKLGKLPARKDAVTFKLKMFEKGTLPTPPKRFGHQGLINAWHMYANDAYGDCVLAGAAHETMLWNKEAGRDVPFTDDNVLADYGAITGFRRDDPNTDNGTDMQQAASYRRKVGIVDANNVRHKLGAYLAIDNGDINQIKQATYLFSAVGLGIMFPESAMRQFNAGKPWSVVKNSPLIGGHYVPVVGYDSSYIYVVTWGKVQPCTYAFVRKYMDEGIVYLSNEFITKTGKSLEGFDLQTLLNNLNSL